MPWLRCEYVFRKHARHRQYINRVRANIHIVLCMSPLGEAFRTRLRMFPSIVNCCTIDWFMEWPDEVNKGRLRQCIFEHALSVVERNNKRMLRIRTKPSMRQCAAHLVAQGVARRGNKGVCLYF